MGGMKKGILSFSVLLVASALLLLLASYSLYIHSLAIANADLSYFEQIHMQSDSAEYGIRSIFTMEAINVSYQGTYIIFRENLSIPSDYASDLSQFKEFMESTALANTTIDISEVQRPTLYIDPQEIVLDHSGNTVSFTPKNAPHSAGDISGYNLTLRMDSITPRFNWTELSDVPDSDPNALFFHIHLTGDNGTISDTWYLDRNNASELQLLNAQNESILKIQVHSPAAMLIEYSTPLYIETLLQLKSNSSVALGRNVINITRVGGTEKIGPVIVAES